MKRLSDLQQDVEDDAAHFRGVYAVVASLLALWLAFWGPPRSPLIRLQSEGQVSAPFEKPNFALPFGDSQILVVLDTYATLISLDGSHAYSAKGGSTVNPTGWEDGERVSLLGKTRVSKGRKAKTGCSWDHGVVVVSEAAVAVGISVTDQSLSLSWETSLENQNVESVYSHRISRQIPSQIILILGSVRGERKLSYRWLLTALDALTGSILWKITLGTPSSATAHFSREIARGFEPYPIRPTDIGIQSIIAAETEMILVKWTHGASLVAVTKETASVVSAINVEDLIMHGNTWVRADINGDDHAEILEILTSENGCLRIANKASKSHSKPYHFNNCTKEESVFPANDGFHVVLLERNKIRAGASSLLGNITLNNREGRGYNLVIFQERTGLVSCISYDGKIMWTYNAMSIENSGTNPLTQRLFALGLSTANDDYQSKRIDALSYGIETSAYLLIIGTNDAVILRASDGVLTSSFPFPSPIRSDPIIMNGRAVFLLENGAVFSVSIKAVRDMIPPLVLVPIMLILCSLWACVMWRRLEDL